MTRYKPRIFALLILLLACNREEEVGLPIVKTENVTITREKTIFQGSITNIHGKNISEHGFVWGQNPSLENSIQILLGSIDADKPFLAEIDAALEPGKTFYVRSFYGIDGKNIYGETVSFDVIYDKAPVIDNFSPAIATWGDTLTISGSNFSLNPDDNLIKFGNIEFTCTEASSKVIKTLVPNSLIVPKVQITVTVFNHKAAAADSFQLAPPQIKSFTPQAGVVETLVTIIGENFKEELTTVYFNSIPATVTSITKKQIGVKVPAGLPRGNVSISVVVANQRVTTDLQFFNNALTVVELSPASGNFNDIVTIKGFGFSQNIAENKVWFGKTTAVVTEATEQFLKVEVPKELNVSKSKITVERGIQSAKSTNVFTLLPPVISGFTPLVGNVRSTIIISGESFNPVPENNIVQIGEASASVLEASSNLLKVSVPDDYTSSSGRSKIKLSVAGVAVESSEQFELMLHEIAMYNPVVGEQGNVLTITGNYFHPVPGKNKVFIGSTEAQVQPSSTTSTLYAIVPPSIGRGVYPLKVRTAGREVIATQSFSSNSPWALKLDIGGGARRHAFSFTIAGRGYVGGGFNQKGFYKNDIFEFDPVANSWIQKSVIPVNGEGMAVFATTAKGYVLYNKELWQYDPVQNKWTRKADFPGDGVRWQSAFAIGDKGYVGTGSTAYYNNTSEFFEYNEQTNTWTVKSAFPAGSVMFGTGFSVGSKGYFATGSWIQRDIWEYDNVNNTWTKKMSLLGIMDGMNEMRLFAVGISGSTKGYISTGSTDSAYGTLYNDLYEYDPAVNRCKKLSSMPGPARKNAFGFLINSKVYLGGGQGWNEWGGYNVLADFYEFTPEN